jgi:phosphatidate cytidylyltransferase
MPSISPKKSFEGLLGGLVGAIAAALLARLWFASELSWFDAIALGILLTLTGLVGDLFESAIKRRAGVKDSGGILPGHGGMLDRIDSLLLLLCRVCSRLVAAPIALYSEMERR